jgi:ABC-type phosphate transport system substrate-binding protein
MAKAWALGYRAQRGVSVTVAGGGSTIGARRVCGRLDAGAAPVDIGAMSRKWTVAEATATATDANGGYFACLQGDVTRKLIQVEVALDGVTVAVVAAGLGTQCLRKMPGLTIAQLRWIFSNYSQAQQGLTTPELVKAVIPNSDGNPATRLWSELNSTCVAAPIRIAGADPLSGTFDFFREQVFAGRLDGESFDNSRAGCYVNSSLDETIVDFVETSSAQDYGDAIAYFGFSYNSQEGALLYGVPIQIGAGRFVAPSRSSITDDSYNPLSRKLYLQLWNNDASLTVTRPFLAYGLSQRGTQIADNADVVTLSFEARSNVLQRLGLTVTNLSAPSPTILHLHHRLAHPCQSWCHPRRQRIDRLELHWPKHVDSASFVV